jgi:transcriptional regulator with XRE-family HTH domain
MDHANSNTAILVSLGRNLTAARVAAGMTQRQLASRVGIALAMLSRIENGHSDPGLRLVDALANELGRDVYELLDHWRYADMTAERDAPEGPSRLPPGLQAHFGTSVRKARGEASLTQAALAELVGMSQQYIAKIEAGQINPTLATMESIATALHLDVGDMLMRSDHTTEWITVSIVALRV